MRYWQPQLRILIRDVRKEKEFCCTFFGLKLRKFLLQFIQTGCHQCLEKVGGKIYYCANLPWPPCFTLLAFVIFLNFLRAALADSISSAMRSASDISVDFPPAIVCCQDEGGRCVSKTAEGYNSQSRASSFKCVAGP